MKRAKSVTPYRDYYENVYEILKALDTPFQSFRNTGLGLAYRTRIRWKDLHQDQFLPKLQRLDLIIKTEGGYRYGRGGNGNTYAIGPKGGEYIRTFEALRDLFDVQGWSEASSE